MPVLMLSMTIAADASKFKKRNNKAKYPDCYCMNKDVRVELGQYACLKVDGRSFLARCEMSTNNPMWREKAPNCPAPTS